MAHLKELPDYYTLAETAQRLNVSRTTLWRMRKRGELPVKQLGGCVRVPRAWTEEHSEAESS